MIRLNYIGIQQKTTYTKWQHAVMVVLAVFLFSAYSIRLQAQTLTIVSSGETGTLGTNWSISGTNPVTITFTGTANIAPSVIEGYLNSGTSVIVNAGLTGNDISVDNAIAKTGGTDATLTLKSNYRASINAQISSSSNKLNLVLWSDAGNDNLGGCAITAPVLTNGGHFWAGGSNSAGGSTTWNGLTVGNGPSVGSLSANYNAFDLGANITTNGGDVLLWASNGDSSRELGIKNNPVIDAGSGNIALLTNNLYDWDSANSSLTISTTGTFSMSYGSAWANAVNWTGTISGSDFTLNMFSQPIVIKNTTTLGGLTIGNYEGMPGVSLVNTQQVQINSAITVAGPVSVYGGDIDVNQDINTTAGNASGDILLKAAGHISLAASKSVTTNGGDVVLWADTDANGGSIFVNTGASIASNGGNVTLSGGLDYTTGYAKGTSFTDWSGVRLDGSINSGAGSVLLRGEMGDIPNGQNTLSPGGVFIVPSGSITATSGNITLAGYVSSNVGTGNALRAIRLGDGIASVGQASITTTSGNISLTGTTAPTYGGAGILFDSSKIQSGSGSITLTGQRGGGEPDLLFNSGTILKNISNQISSTTGNITMNANSLEVWGEGDLYSRLPISSAGQLTIQPRTAGTTIGLSGGTGSLSLPASLFSTSFNNGFSSITIGHSTAGNITVGGALSYNDPLTLKTPGGIVVNANASISGTTSQNAHLVLWADADGNNGGVIIVNSGSSIATNGGHFWMGGGSGSTTWNGLTVGDGYATGVDATGVRDGVLINNATINTSGGDIALYGKSAVSANIEAGIRLNDHLSGSASTVVNSGAGKILLDGIGRGSAGFAGVEFNTTNTAATVRITSTNTTAEAITINGDSQAATASGWGLLFYFGTEISATGAGGGITIIGKINNLGGKAIGFHSPGQTGTRVLANGGPIIFNAITNGTGNSIYAVGNNMVVGQLAGSTVPTSSSNITLNIDRPMTGTSTNVPDLTFSSSGSLAIQPLTANTTIGIGGATGTVPLPASLFTTSFADGFSQITIGGSTQSGNINLNSVTFRDNMHLQTTGTVGVNAGQTITATGIKLQIDNTLGMGAGSSLIR